MKTNPIQGKAIQWTFDDGPMAQKTFEHTFNRDGSVTWCTLDAGKRGNPSTAERSEVASVGQDVYVVSYLGASGYTLTVVLDFRTHHLVAFASNEASLTVQKGTFKAERP
jgi:MoaF N-terminal domain